MPKSCSGCQDDCMLPCWHHQPRHCLYPLYHFQVVVSCGCQLCGPPWPSTSRQSHQCSLTLGTSSSCMVLEKTTPDTDCSQHLLHAEYVALSVTLCKVIVLQWILQELMTCKHLGNDIPPPFMLKSLKTTTWPTCLPQNHHLTNCSHWLSTSLHFFWELINSGIMTVLPISGSHSNYLTKGLAPEKSDYNCKQLFPSTVPIGSIPAYAFLGVNQLRNHDCLVHQHI